jgi:hypothetical protein
MPTELEQLFEKYMQAPKASSPESFLRSLYAFMPKKKVKQPFLPANRTMNSAEASRRWEEASPFSIQQGAWNNFLQQMLQDELGIQWPPHQW